MWYLLLILKTGGVRDMTNSLSLNLKKVLCLGLLSSALFLSACGEYRKTDKNIADSTTQADAALAQIAPKGKVAQTLEIDNRPYYGARAVPIANSFYLPTQFEQPDSIVMTFARAVTLPEFTRMIQSVTGVRTNVAGSVTEAGGGGRGRDATAVNNFMPSGGEQVSGGRVVWQGRLSDLLNQAADFFRADWRYDGSTITFSQQITRTFMLHSLASELQISGSVSSGSSSGSTSGGSLPQVNVSSNTSFSVWKEIEDAIETIMGDNGTASFSPSTGTITVSSTPDVVRRVESYLHQQNAMRLRRVVVAVKVLSVTLKNDMDIQTDFTGTLKRVIEKAGMSVSPSTSTGGLTLSMIKDPARQISADTLVANLNLEQGIDRASIVYSGALMTLSDQPAPLQVGRQISYLARTSSSSSGSSDSGSSVSLEPGTIDTGLMMTVLPRIVEQNRVLMRVSVAITDLTNLTSFGNDQNRIQLPEVETTGFLQNAVMTSGETMVLAGFEKDGNSRSMEGAPGPLSVLRTRQQQERARTVTVLMLTSEILPEEPMTVIGQ